MIKRHNEGEHYLYDNEKAIYNFFTFSVILPVSDGQKGRLMFGEYFYPFQAVYPFQADYPVSDYYTPLKYILENLFFWMFSDGIEIEHWLEMG